MKARGNVWEQRAVKRYENGRESGQDRVTEHEEEEEEPGVVVEGEESSDQSSCFFSAHNSQEGGEEEEREEEEVLGVFFCKRERSLRGGGSHDVDLITWEDDEEGYERGEEVAGVDDGRDKCTWNHLLSIVNMLPLSYISQISPAQFIWPLRKSHILACVCPGF